MDLVAEATFRPDAHDVTNDQHPDDQFWINRGTPEVTVEGAKGLPHPIHVEEPVDFTKHMTGRNMTLQIEVIEQLCRCRLGAHRDEILQSPHNRVNQRTCRAVTKTISTASALCVDRPLLLLSRVDAVLGDDLGPVSAFLLGTIVASVAGGNTLNKVRTMRTRLRTPKFSLQLENLRDLAHRIPK